MQWRQPCRFEEQRHQLIRALERELGRKEAATLMKLVPSIPWHGFATMRDLDHHGVLWRSEAARVEGSIERLEARTEAMINDAVHRLTFRLLPAMATMIAVFGAIAALV